MRSGTIGALLDATVAADPARPLLTYYGTRPDERVELSAVTLRNWVDKTANLLRDLLDADVGSRVSVGLPAHWQTVVWVLACWRLGAVVVPVEAGPDVAVVGPEPLASRTLPDAPEVVVTSLHPLGARLLTPLPPGVTDYGAEVFAQADTFGAGRPLSAATPGWQQSTAVLDHGGLTQLAAARAAELGLAAGGRLASDANPATLPGAVSVALVPLLVDGTVVLLGDPEQVDIGRVADTERVDVTAFGASPGRR